MTLAHEDRGTGDAIVLIHGHPFDRRMWLPQVRVLSDEFRLVAPDLPGYGESPSPAATVTMRELAEAVILTLDAIDVPRAAIVGLSMGGLVAMELALGWPQRVAGLVLAATTVARVTAEEAERRWEVAAGIERDGMLTHVLDMAGRLFGETARRDPAIVAEVLDMMLHTPPAGAAAALRGRALRPDYSRRLRGLKIPSLVIAGDQDGYAPEPVVEQLVASLDRPEVLRLAGVGHLPNLEAPEQFNAALRRFARA